jgi:subtilisin family serine protease
MSGTSMAGPHVAGVVALMWSANPQLIGNIERTARILRETARPFSGHMESDSSLAAEEQIDSAVPATPETPAADACILAGPAGERPNNLVGYGIVDAYAAVQRALTEPQ